MKSKKVEMDAVDFWNLRSAHEDLAVKSKDIREIVLCAKVRLGHISLNVSMSGRENKLCYDSDNEHMYSAMRLLTSARDIEHNIT